MSDDRWYYFLSLEKDFMQTIDYVEIHPNNGTAFSNEYAKLLLLIGSEVDVVAKMLCNREAPGQAASNILHYQSILTTRFAGIHSIEIEVTRYKRKVQPWLSWNPASPIPPIWWTAHNKVKHKRDIEFWRANQQNTLEAICALLALLLYWFKDEVHLQPYPQLLNFGFPAFIVGEGGPKPPGA